MLDWAGLCGIIWHDGPLPLHQLLDPVAWMEIIRVAGDS
jgi:hypothetical protein